MVTEWLADDVIVATIIDAGIADEEHVVRFPELCLDSFDTLSFAILLIQHEVVGPLIIDKVGKNTAFPEPGAHALTFNARSRFLDAKMRMVN